jgi:hypothetical protein
MLTDLFRWKCIELVSFFLLFDSVLFHCNIKLITTLINFRQNIFFINTSNINKKKGSKYWNKTHVVKQSTRQNDEKKWEQWVFLPRSWIACARKLAVYCFFKVGLVH